MKKVFAYFLSFLFVLSQNNYSFANEDTAKPNLTISVETTSIGQQYIKIDATDEGGSGIRKVEINENTADEVTFRNGTSETEMHTAYFPQKSGVYTITAYDRISNKIEKTVTVSVDDSYILPVIDVYGKSYDPVTKDSVIQVNSWKESGGKNLVKVVNPDGTEVIPSDPSRPYSIKYEYTVSAYKSYDFYVQDINGYINLDRCEGSSDTEEPNLKVSIISSESNPNEMIIRINAWDGYRESGIDRVEVVNGPTFAIENTDQYSIKTTYTPLSDGEYTFIAYDKKGNSTTKSVNFSTSSNLFPEIVAEYQGDLESLLITARSLSGSYLKEIELPTGEYIEIEANSLIKTISYTPETAEKLNFSVIDEKGLSSSVSITPIDISSIEALVQKVEETKTIEDLSIARDSVNTLPESTKKDTLQDRLDAISLNISLEIKNATGNLDVYIKCENMLLMSLDTNSITFEDFSGVEDVEKSNAVNITISSSLPYQLNAYLPTEIQNADKSNTLDKSILNIKENGETVYQEFINTTDKIILKDNCSAGNNIIHGINIKLKGGIAHEKDVYKTTIKLEVQQK